MTSDERALSIIKKYLEAWKDDVGNKEHWRAAENAWSIAGNWARGLAGRADNGKTSSENAKGFVTVRETENAVESVVETFEKAIALSAKASEMDRISAKEIKDAMDWIVWRLQGSKQ